MTRSMIGFHVRSRAALRTEVRRHAMSEKGRYCCKSRYSPMTKILRVVGATFAYKMRGTSRPHAKFAGDFGNAIELIRISDRSLLSVFREEYRALQLSTFATQSANNRRRSSGHSKLAFANLPPASRKTGASLFESALILVASLWSPTTSLAMG
jgi:hypothetical protein